jgi:uncharacterized protein with von Willebrand factor type A (vWA) domain
MLGRIFAHAQDEMHFLLEQLPDPGKPEEAAIHQVNRALGDQFDAQHFVSVVPCPLHGLQYAQGVDALGRVQRESPQNAPAHGVVVELLAAMALRLGQRHGHRVQRDQGVASELAGEVQTLAHQPGKDQG